MAYARNGNALSNFVSDSELDDLDDMVTVTEKPPPRRRAPAAKAAVAKPTAPVKPAQRARKTKQEPQEVPEPAQTALVVQEASDENAYQLSQVKCQNEVFQDQIKSAEANFEALKIETSRNAKAAQDLIESLKAELLESQKENRSLTNKLSTARSANAHTSINQPSSKQISVGSIEAAQLAEIKENLYGDLTGLILRSVKREDEVEVYDCLQTGRNGTLHFKLAIDNGAGSSYEETECHYTPLLDESRDSALIDLLPDYLTEEITFSRERAAMFYSRIIQTLSRQG